MDLHDRIILKIWYKYMACIPLEIISYYASSLYNTNILFESNSSIKLLHYQYINLFFTPDTILISHLLLTFNPPLNSCPIPDS